MAEIAGKVSKLEYAGGKVDSFDDFSLSIDTDMLDTTTFSTGTVQWRDFITGLSGWTATASANFDAASTGLTNIRTNTLTPTTASIAFVLDKVGGETFSGSCFISSLGHSAPIEGKVEVDVSIQGTGALTFSTTT